MFKTENRQIGIILSGLMILTLALTACSSPVATEVIPAESTTGAPATDAATEVPATAAVTEAPAAACPVGHWQLADFSSYLSSLGEQLNSSFSGATVTDTGSTGSAQFTFNANGSSSFTAENFIENFTVAVDVSGMQMNIPVVLTINGTSTATYTLEGDQMTFTDQDAGDLVINVNISGNDTVISNNVMGEPGTIKLYQFSCADENTLSLKVTAVTNMDLAPLQLTRIP